MADEPKPDEGQKPTGFSPDVQARIDAATKRAEKLQADLDARKAAAAASSQDADAARKQADADAASAAKEAAQRAAAEKRVGDLEAKLIEQAMDRLGDEEKAKAEKYKGKMNFNDFIEFIDDMFHNREGGEDTAAEGNTGVKPPPKATPSGPLGQIKQKGRELHPETLAVLQHARGYLQTTEYARRLLEDANGDGRKWQVPVQRLIAAIESRASYATTKGLGRGRANPEQISEICDMIDKHRFL